MTIPNGPALGIPNVIPNESPAMTQPHTTPRTCDGIPNGSPRNPPTLGVGALPYSRAPNIPNPQRVVIFDVVGDPAAQPRAKAVALGPKRAKIVTPRSADAWKHEIRAHALAAARAEGWTLSPPGAAVLVFLAFRLARPKSHFRTGRFAGILKPGAPEHHTQTPDKDNLEKAVLDALTAFEDLPPVFWCDDAQAIDGRTSKRWTRPGEPPGVAVGIYET